MSEPALAEILPASERTQTISVIERIVAEGREVEKETDVLVRPLTLLKWLTATKYVGNVLQYIPADGLDLDGDLTKSVVYLLQAAGAAQDDLIALVGLATGKDAEFFDRIDLDDGVKIIIAVVQVNKDFFVQKVLPLVSQHLPNIQETFGQTQSPS